MNSAYEIYCEWCLDHHRAPPSREWWDSAIRQPRPPARKTVIFEPDFDIETEQREGWTYD